MYINIKFYLRKCILKDYVRIKIKQKIIGANRK